MPPGTETIDRELLARLERAGQTGVLRFWNALDAAGRDRLASQLIGVDLSTIASLVGGEDVAVDFAELARRATLPPAVSSSGEGATWSLREAAECGDATLAGGKVAVVLVAGGQGTRLGFDQPKGMFPAGPVSGRTLFQMFADRLLATERRYGVRVPLYLMTSAATDEATRDYFRQHDFLGLREDQVTIFQQGTMPAVDAKSGELLLAEKDSLALSPDGHGGTLGALDQNGCLDAMRAAGNDCVFYFQVDNPLVTLCDPVFIGHHQLAKSEMTTQVIRKRYPTERVGNVVQVDGRTMIIEYSDLPDEAAQQTNPDGGLKLWAGSIAVHLLERSFLERVKHDAAALPFHRALKKVPYLDASGELVDPAEPNAIKFERFIFDLLPSAERTIICEVEPAQAFAPIKNADGAATDTPKLARQAVSDLHRSWLRHCGAEVAEEAKVEINPKFAIDPQELAARIAPGTVIDEDHYFS